MFTFYQLKMSLTLIILISIINTAYGSDFPLREKYKGIPIISTSELAKILDEIIVVDVRSELEYNVAHIKDAKRIPVSTKKFEQKLGKIRTKDDSKKIVFYCNGHTCSKSYKATKRAIDGGFKNVFAYDSGIFEWMISQPDQAVFLGKTPVNTQKIISKPEFIGHMLSFNEFKARAKNPQTVVIDIREHFQKIGAKEKLSNQFKILRIPQDKFLKNVISKGTMKDKHLLIYDQVGKQIRWIHYYLKENGYQNFHFLKTGIEGIKS